MSELIERIWKRESFLHALAASVLFPLSLVFGALVWLRNYLYQRNRLPVENLAVPVVSVGNIRVGGSGKTPFVMWLVERLQAEGLTPFVLGRGYGARLDRPLLVVAAESSLVDAGGRQEVEVAVLARFTGAAVPDEAALVAFRTGAPVLCFPDRAVAGRIAVGLGADVVLLDDGFQHRRLARDLDIVLVDQEDLGAAMLPAGPLRESPAALERADHIVWRGQRWSGKFRTKDPPFSEYSMRFAGWVGDLAQSAPELAADALSGRDAIAVVGIAQPDRFLTALHELGVRVLRTFIYADHHGYDSGNWREIVRAASACELIVTTEKDLVKLRAFNRSQAGASPGTEPASPELLALRLQPEIERGEALIERVRSLVLSRDALGPQ